MAGTEVRDAQGNLKYTGPNQQERAKAETNAAVDKGMEKSAASPGEVRRTTEPVPKAADFGGDMTRFAEAMRKWRERQQADPEVQARKRALGKVGQ
jgi:hypothetical protein